MDAESRVRGPLNATPDIFYDAAGNVLSITKHASGQPFYTFTQDALNMQSGFRRTNSDGSTAEDYLYVYGPGNYRFLVFRTDGANANRTFTIRGLDNKPLTRFIVTGFDTGAQWNWEQDSLHGANGIFAAIRSDSDTYHYHPDHLGSPRILTNQSGAYLSERHYYPYGTEYVRFENRPDDISTKFTGHERDPNGLTDYMLGRTYVYPLGRFASVDPARDGWNLYGYVGGNPIGAVDPDGLKLRFIGSSDELRAVEAAANSGLAGQTFSIDQNGYASITPASPNTKRTPEQEAAARHLSNVINDSGTVEITTSSGSGTIIGNYLSEDIDIKDIEAIGDGQGPTRAGALVHEIVEQFEKQINKKGFQAAHAAGIVAESEVTGFVRGPEGRATRNGNQILRPVGFSSGNLRVLATFITDGPNIVGVNRKVIK